MLNTSTMIDISDGFGQDLNHMLKLSKVGVRLEGHDTLSSWGLL